MNKKNFLEILLSQDKIHSCMYIQNGSKLYALSSPNSNINYLSVHFSPTINLIEHPDFRINKQVIRKHFNKNLEPIAEGIKDGDISLDSFEIWKLVTLWLKGSPIAYELLNIRPQWIDPLYEELFILMKQGTTNRIGKTVKGMVLHNWRKHKSSRKKTVMAYYRLLQSLYFLTENRFECNSNELWKYGDSITNNSQNIKNKYMDITTRELPLTSVEISEASKDLSNLIDQVDKSMITTGLPDQVPRKCLDHVLGIIKNTRLNLI